MGGRQSMINAIIPKFLFEDEEIITLKDRGIKIQEGNQIIGKYKVPCYKFFNLSETEVFDELYKESFYEAEGNTQADISGYVNRISSVMFLRIRQASMIKDKETKIAAACSLLASVNALAALSVKHANRFVPLIRGIM